MIPLSQQKGLRIVLGCGYNQTVMLTDPDAAQQIQLASFLRKSGLRKPGLRKSGGMLAALLSVPAAVSGQSSFAFAS